MVATNSIISSFKTTKLQCRAGITEIYQQKIKQNNYSDDDSLQHYCFWKVRDFKTSFWNRKHFKIRVILTGIFSSFYSWFIDSPKKHKIPGSILGGDKSLWGLCQEGRETSAKSSMRGYPLWRLLVNKGAIESSFYFSFIDKTIYWLVQKGLQ